MVHIGTTKAVLGLLRADCIAGISRSDIPFWDNSAGHVSMADGRLWADDYWYHHYSQWRWAGHTWRH